MGLASYKIQREPVKRKPIGHEDGASVYKCVEVILYFFAVRVLCIVLDDLERVYRSQMRRCAVSNHAELHVIHRFVVIYNKIFV